MTKPRIGVVAYWKGYDRKIYLKAAELADELGFESFWVPEAWGYDVISLITEMALHTRRIKLATGIVNVYSRSPGLLAMSAATLHEISHGRFILGIGTSGQRVVEGFHGRRFDKPLSQTREVMRIVRGLLRGESLEKLGELSPYRPFTLATKGSHYDVPIYVAALKQKAIESVGELADGWMPAFWPFAELHRGLSWLQAGAQRAGRDPSQIDVAPLTAAIPLGRKYGMGIAKDILSFYIGGMGDFYKELLSGLGFAEDCERIAALYQDRATRAEAKKAVPDAMVEAMTVSGDPLEVRTKLLELKTLGVTQPLLGLPASASWPTLAGYLRAVAPGSTPSLLQLMATGALRTATAVTKSRA